MSSKFNNIEYLHCPNVQHKKQLLISVCVDKNCNNRALICYLCEKDSHSGHETLTLGEYLDSLHNQHFQIRSEINLQPFLQASIQKIRMTRARCLRSLEETKERIERAMKGMEAKIIEFFDVRESSAEDIVDNYETRTGKEFIYNHKKKVEKIQQDFRRQLRYYHLKGNTREKLTEEMEELVRTSLVREKEFEMSLDSIVHYLMKITLMDSQMNGTSHITTEQFRFNIEKEVESPGKKSLNGNEGILRGMARWSKHFRHSDIEINGFEVKRTLESVKLRHVGVLIEGALQDGKLELLHIKQKTCGIIVGVCLESKAKQSKMIKDQWNNIGHGHYVISNDGLIWSHSDRSVNYKVKGFRFGTNDEIEIFYKKSVNKIEFSKSGTAEKLEMEIEPAAEDDCYRICAYMMMKGEGVSIASKRLEE